jgi:hypothetical protein
MTELNHTELNFIDGAGLIGAAIGSVVGRVLTGTDEGERKYAKKFSDVEDALRGCF